MTGGHTRALVIDDLRVLPDRTGVTYSYARSLNEAFECLHAAPWDEMWFDHDLGGDETIRPFVNEIERRVFLGADPNSITGVCYILTDNPVGAHWLQAALGAAWPVHVYHGDWKIDLGWRG